MPPVEGQDDPNRRRHEGRVRELDPNHMDQLIRLFEEIIPFNRLLGLKVKGLGDGKATVEIPFREELVGDILRPAQHGGVIAAAIDAAGGLAAFTKLSAEDRLSTVDMRVDYLHPALKKTLIVESEIIRIGNRMTTVASHVFHEDDGETMLATGKAVYNIRRNSHRT